MKVALASVLALSLAACARDDASYPSLAPRAVEGRGFAEPPVTPPAPAAVDPALDARLADAGKRLDAIVAGYAADLARADRAAGVAGAAKVGGEAWVAAQTAVAALDDWRAQAGGIATELDELARERIAATGAPYPALDALRARTEAETAREAAGTAAVGARLPTP